MLMPLTADQARDAICIDFEGLTDQAPVLIGIDDPLAVGRPRFEQVVLDPRFEPAAHAKGLRVAGLADTIEAIVVLAEQTGRPIMGWSGHEPEVVGRYCPGPLARRFSYCYVDAKVAAKVARRGLHVILPEVKGATTRNALARYLAFLGFAVPSSFGPGKTGKRIRGVGDALDRKPGWAAITPVQKGYWSNLLSHNRLDVEGTRAVATWATGVIDATSRVATGTGAEFAQQA
jgi:hypothetical protein